MPRSLLPLLFMAPPLIFFNKLNSGHPGFWSPLVSFVLLFGLLGPLVLLPPWRNAIQRLIFKRAGSRIEIAAGAISVVSDSESRTPGTTGRSRNRRGRLTRSRVLEEVLNIAGYRFAEDDTDSGEDPPWAPSRVARAFSGVRASDIRGLHAAREMRRVRESA